MSSQRKCVACITLHFYPHSRPCLVWAQTALRVCFGIIVPTLSILLRLQLAKAAGNTLMSRFHTATNAHSHSS